MHATFSQFPILKSASHSASERIVAKAPSAVRNLLHDGDPGVSAPTLSQPPGFSLRLQKCQHVSFSDRALHVPDDGAAAVIHEVNTHLKPEEGSTNT